MAWSVFAGLTIGFVHLIVDEDLTGDAARYRIAPDAGIYMPQVEGTTRDWKTVKKDAKEVVVVAGDAQVTLAFSPFKVSVIVKGKPAVTLNAKGLFDFEHTRAKEVRSDASSSHEAWLMLSHLNGG